MDTSPWRNFARSGPQFQELGERLSTGPQWADGSIFEVVTNPVLMRPGADLLHVGGCCQHFDHAVALACEKLRPPAQLVCSSAGSRLRGHSAYVGLAGQRIASSSVDTTSPCASAGTSGGILPTGAELEYNGMICCA